MNNNESMAWLPRIGIFLPFGIASFTRGLTLSPFLPNHENPPAPLIFHQIGGPEIFSLLWMMAGLLVIVSTFVGHKFIILKGDVVQFRVDDLALILMSFMYLLWGASYYGHWLYQTFVLHTYSGDFSSGRNYMPVAIAGFSGWYLWFGIRAKREVERRAKHFE